MGISFYMLVLTPWLSHHTYMNFEILHKQMTQLSPSDRWMCSKIFPNCLLAYRVIQSCYDGGSCMRMMQFCTLLWHFLQRRLPEQGSPPNRHLERQLPLSQSMFKSIILLRKEVPTPGKQSWSKHLINISIKAGQRRGEEELKTSRADPWPINHSSLQCHEV